MCLFSLGCDIGYGYLHRVPQLTAGGGNKLGFATQTSTPAALPQVGLTEVMQHVSKIIYRCQFPSRSGDVLINVGNCNSAHQVHLSAVIPTIPVAESSTLQQPVVGSNMTTVISNLHTGTLSSLTLPNSLNKAVVFCRSYIGVCTQSVT